MNARLHRHLTLASSVVGAMVVALDGTVLTVAQPTLQRDLHASFAQVQWTSTAYLIAVASLLVFAGRLGDRYGHHRLFAAGMLGFGATSAGIGVAPGIGWVIGLRVAQGVFGALLQPATLGMLRAAFPPDRLGMPIALRTSAIGLAAATGPVVGGVLVTQLGWRAVFFLNVVPALVMGVLALTVRTSPPVTSSGTASRLDVPGACLLALALVCLVHTLVEVPRTGWTAATVLGPAGFAAAGTVFVRHERRTAQPLVPTDVLRSRAVGAALAVLVTASASLSGALFVSVYYLQNVRGLDPFGSSLRALPLAVAMVVAAPLAAVVMRRFGPRLTAGAAMSLLVVGMLLLSRLDRASSDGAVGGGFLFLGAGFGTAMVTATAVVVRQVSVASAGVAGGLQQTAMNVGPTLGVATATTLMTYTSVAMGPALTTLAVMSAIGAAFTLRLPGRSEVVPAPHLPSGAESRARTRA